MSTRLDDLRMVDPILTTIAQGYSNSSFISETLFPVVKVKKMKGKFPIFGDEAFFAKPTARGLGANSNRIPSAEFTLSEFETKERDVEMAIDYLEEEEAARATRLETRITKSLTDILKLGKEREAADLAQKPSNYSAGLKQDIALADAFNNYAGDSDPIEIIKDAMEAVRAKIAVFPNTMILGEKAYRALSSHPKILERVRYSGKFQAGVDVLSAITDIPTIKVGRAVYKDDSGDFKDVWEDNLVLAYVDRGENGRFSEFNPSFGYTFQKENMPETDTYYENGGKIKVIRATDNYAVQVTANQAAFLIYNTIHSIGE